MSTKDNVLIPPGNNYIDTAPLPLIEDADTLKRILSTLNKVDSNTSSPSAQEPDMTDKNQEDTAHSTETENSELIQSTLETSKDEPSDILEQSVSSTPDELSGESWVIGEPMGSTRADEAQSSNQPDSSSENLVNSLHSADDSQEGIKKDHIDTLGTKEERNFFADNVKANSVIEPISINPGPERAAAKKSSRLADKKLWILIGGLAAILAGVYCWGLYYYKDRFFPNTYISGTDVANLTKEEALAKLDSVGKERKVTIKGKDGVESELKAEQVGLTFNDSPNIEETLANQNIYEWPKYLLADNSVYVESGHTIDENALESEIQKLPIVSGEQVVPTANAHAKYDGNQFVVENEVYGTNIDTAKLKESIRQSLLTGDDVITLDKEGLYVMPEIKSDNTTLANSINTLNSALNTVVTYDFKASQETLDKNTFSGWLSTNEKGEVVFDTAQSASYINGLAEKYDTLGKPIAFTTSGGTPIELEDWYVGWEIDQDEENSQLQQVIMAGQPVTREPVYSTTGRDRSKPNAITGTYLEISIGDQTMWYYRDGQLIVSTPVVTGDTSTGYGTPTGLYELYSKSTNVTLTGNNADGSAYESPVTFWMPFNGGIGVHDASWRSSYGGSIFQGNGSHGCVNTPYAAARTIYDNISVGDPVVVYW